MSPFAFAVIESGTIYILLANCQMLFKLTENLDCRDSIGTATSHPNIFVLRESSP